MGSPTTSIEFSSLQELLSSSSLPKLESGVDMGIKILGDIKAGFEDAKSVPEIAEYIDSLDKLRSGARSQRTVIGVVGSTGAGKSSVINAVLDEECLVPTNCMRACTAVITELAYNSSVREDEKYRAEIHFVSTDEWARELLTMLDDMNAGQLSPGTQSTDSDASIAYKKVRSVYPSLSSDEIKSGEVTAEGLAQDPSVTEVLGTVKQIASSTSTEFLDFLKKFIDSKEKTRGKKKEPDAMEYWPLIKVVKVFVKSPVLQSGLVLVDLPGVQDSNAARSAVASNYIEQCSGLWVVAPVTRAVDDKAAQTLLDTAFKRQLQFDGTFSSITVVCSKADDISVTEALKVLPEDDAAHQHHENAQLLETERGKVQKAIAKLKAQITEHKRTQDDQFREIDSLKAALRRSDHDDELLLVSPGGTRKRHASAAVSEARKKLRLGHTCNTDGTDSDEDEDLVASETEPEEEEEEEEVSREIASKRLEETEAQNSALRVEAKKLELDHRAQHRTLKEIKSEIKALTSLTKRACIRFRNKYARPEIQAQFAEGIRELDQDSAAYDEENYDPSHVERDYAGIAKKLPVFCVSSRAYQKISGRLEKDDAISGFTNVDDTEIPALQRHALSVVQETRAAACRRFLRDLRHFLTSLYLQVVLSDQPLKLAGDLREKELQFLAGNVRNLRQAVSSDIEQALAQCRKAAETHIFDRFIPAADLASEAAVSTANSWICHKNDGGLLYQTFRATCVRKGVFKGRRGAVDFNTALAEPMTKHIARPWEYVFSSQIPDRLDILATALGKLLSSFQTEMSQRSELQTAPSFALVTGQVTTLKDTIQDTADLKGLVHAHQKHASRQIVPRVERAMEHAYGLCVQESGPGSYKRAKEHLQLHIENNRGVMFHAAAQKVEAYLRKALDELQRKVESKMEGIVVLINKDYSALLADGNIFKALSAARDELRGVLTQVDKRFENILHPQTGVDDGDCFPTGAAKIVLKEEM